MASKMKMTGIRLTDEQNFKMRYIANYNHRKINDEFRLIIEKHIKEYEAEHGPIQLNLDRQGGGE